MAEHLSQVQWRPSKVTPSRYSNSRIAQRCAIHQESQSNHSRWRSWPPPSVRSRRAEPQACMVFAPNQYLPWTTGRKKSYSAYLMNVYSPRRYHQNGKRLLLSVLEGTAAFLQYLVTAPTRSPQHFSMYSESIGSARQTSKRP